MNGRLQCTLRSGRGCSGCSLRARVGAGAGGRRAAAAAAVAVAAPEPPCLITVLPATVGRESLYLAVLVQQPALRAGVGFGASPAKLTPAEELHRLQMFFGFPHRTFMAMKFSMGMASCTQPVASAPAAAAPAAAARPAGVAGGVIAGSSSVALPPPAGPPQSPHPILISTTYSCSKHPRRNWPVAAAGRGWDSWRL